MHMYTTTAVQISHSYLTSISSISYRYRFFLSSNEFVHIHDDIVSVLICICTQLQLAIFNVDIDDIVSILICICTELNLSILKWRSTILFQNLFSFIYNLIFCILCRYSRYQRYRIDLHKNTTATLLILTSMSSISTIS